MTPIESATQQLEKELSNLGLGGKVKIQENSVEWLLLRAKAIGLSYLRRLQKEGVDRMTSEAEAVYKEMLGEIKVDKPS